MFVSANTDQYQKTYLPIDVAVNNECSKLSPIFVACFSPQIYAIIQVPAIYFPYGFCTNEDSYCSNFLALYLQVYESQEAETLAVHSLFTIQNPQTIKRHLSNLHNVVCLHRGPQILNTKLTTDMTNMRIGLENRLANRLANTSF